MGTIDKQTAVVNVENSAHYHFQNLIVLHSYTK